MTNVTHYMLDTNTAGYIIKGQPAILKDFLRKIPIGSVCISSIVEAELLFGVAKRPDARQLQRAVKEFLLWMDCALGFKGGI